LRLRRQRRPRLGRVEQHRDVVDTAIHGAALDAHDVRHREPGRRRGGSQIRRVLPGVYGLKQLFVGGAAGGLGSGSAVEQLTVVVR